MRSLSAFTIRAGCLALGVAVCGCARTEPYQRVGVWHPVGANAANLEAMVANPQDLRKGRGTGMAPGDLAGAAAIRLRTGTVRKLPASSISKVQTTAGGGGSDGGSNGPSGAAPVDAAATGGGQ
jgi:hypothetical protein